jgi:hypothetical protein
MVSESAYGIHLPKYSSLYDLKWRDWLFPLGQNKNLDLLEEDFSEDNRLTAIGERLKGG